MPRELELGAHALEIDRGVHVEPRPFSSTRDEDLESVLERAQLLEPLAPTR